LRNTSVIRLIEGRLAWYPPGAGEEPLWLDDVAAAERLRAALARRSTGVCFAAPAVEVRVLPLPVSSAEKKHIGKSLPYMLEEQVAEDIEALHFASSALADDAVAVAVTSRERMGYWQELFEGLPGISHWYPETLMLPWQAGEWCLVIEGERAIARTGACEGFGVEISLLPAMLAATLAETGAPQVVVVYGSDQEADVDRLPVEVRECVQWRSGGFYAATMLAEADSTGLNLLQGDFAARLPLGRWWRQWRPVAAMFALAFVIQLVATYSDYLSLQRQNLALRGAVEASYRRAYPQGAVVDAEKQLQRQLDAMRGSAQTSGFVALMAKVGAVVAERPGTRIASINYNDKADQMRMNIVAADFEAVEQVRSAINRSGLEAVMESSSAQADGVRARLRVGDRT
jgi:type II secretion system protein L